MIGKVISHYRIEEQLGGGGMGVVYRAQDLKLGRSVALKFLPAELVREHQALERFQREARAASGLNHPNICTIHEVDEWERQPFIVMEFLEGHTLKHSVLGRPLNSTQILEITIHVAHRLPAVKPHPKLETRLALPTVVPSRSVGGAQLSPEWAGPGRFVAKQRSSARHTESRSIYAGAE